MLTQDKTKPNRFHCEELFSYQKFRLNHKFHLYFLLQKHTDLLKLSN